MKIVKTSSKRWGLMLAAVALAACSRQDGGPPVRAGGPAGIALAQGGVSPLAGATLAAGLVVNRPAQLFLVAGTTADDGNADGDTMLSHFRDPDGVAGDAYGNIYVADTGNHTIRRITPDGFVTTVAGKAGEAGSSDGRSGQARFNAPAGLRFDDAGNLYVADSKNHVIRRMAPDGQVTTVAGKAGEYGAADGAPDVARLAAPRRIAIGAGGVLYVAAPLDGAIRRVAPDGSIATLVTDAPRIFSRVGGEPGLIPFGDISGIAAGLDGNLYVADARDNTVRKITPDGHVIHLAGKPRASTDEFAGEFQTDGVGARAHFNQLGDIVAHRDGSLTLLSAYSVRRIEASGAVTTATRFDGHGFADYLSALGVDGNGDVLMTRQHVEAAHQRTRGLSAIYRVPAGGGLAPVAPKPLAAPALWQDGNWIIAGDNYPVEFDVLAFAPGGGLYAADSYSRTLYYMDRIGRFGQRVLRDGAGGSAYPRPHSLAFDGKGNAYAAGTQGIDKISPEGEVSKLSSNKYFFSVAVTATGTVYASSPEDGVVYRVMPDGQLEVHAGAVGDKRHRDGARPQARLAWPGGLAADAAGNLYVAEYGNHTIRKISADGMVSTLAGRPGAQGSDDGAAATFSHPAHVAADQHGNVYVAQNDGGPLVRRIGADGLVSTVAGTRGATGITRSSLGQVRGIAAAPNGDVYLASGKALLRLVMQ